MTSKDKRPAKAETSPAADAASSVRSGESARQRAEAIAGERAAQLPKDIDALSPEATRRTLHELRVHQIELEMQNEELRRAQAELGASQARYFSFYDLAPVGYVSCSDKMLILEANPTTANLLGVSRDALVKQSINRFILKDDADIFYMFRNQLFEFGHPQSCELRMIKREGTPFWVHLAGSVARDAERARAYRFVLSDISERKRAEKTLRDSEEKFRALFENAKDGILLLSANGDLIALNASFASMHGYTVEEMLRLNLRDLDTPKSAPVAPARIKRLLAGEHLTFAVEHYCKNGQTIPLEVSASTFDLGGETCICGFHRDIGERQRADKALAESEERFSLFMDTLPAAAFIKGENSTTLFANRYLADIVGGRAWLGKSAWDLFPPKVAEKMIADDLRALAAGHVVTEEQVPGADGQMRFYQTHKFSLPRQGQTPLLGGIALDITERKRAEEKLFDMAAGLENAINVRTRQLRTVSAQLTLIEERERRMLAQDLHDNLGQLLAVIKIKLTSLAAASPRSSVDPIVELVDQADRSVRMITQQLSPTILRTLGFMPALEWLAEEMESVYGLAVHIDNETWPQPPECIADALQAVLYRCVRELLINVAKHARVKKANLSCLCDGRRLLLVVSDDGCGFDPAGSPGALPRQRSFGLSSIHERMLNIGGEMEIDSSPGNGATISLSLPHSAATEEAQPS